nr:cytochrome P450 CYP6BX1 [Dendroctonus rhizophagus]
MHGASYLIYFLIVFIGLLGYLLRKAKKTYNYWKEHGVPSIDDRHLIYGNLKEAILLKKSSAEVYGEFYQKFKKRGLKHGGVYFYSSPTWVLVDPDLIKTVLISDFQHFAAHNPMYLNTIFFNNLFHMQGEQWKDMRRKLAPTFTSGKMKMMFNILLEKTHGLADLVDGMASTGEAAEIKELVARFTTDVIGSCGFGIESDSLKDVNSSFFQHGQSIFKKLTPKAAPQIYKLILRSLGLIKRFNIDLEETEAFFRKLVEDTVKYREENKIVRKDFLHLMIQLKNNGTITDILNDSDIFIKSRDEAGLSMEEMVGQCLLFFMAGFETSSTTLSFVFLELSRNQSIQEKLRKEIHTVLEKYNGILSYDSLQEMTYCECVINETLRKYPPVASLPRMCTKDYAVPESDALIEKNTLVVIPLLALQTDPDYFPEPEKFIPERFSAKNQNEKIPFIYMPFGEGPRQCLGLRFGIMQVKAAIATLLNRYNFTLDKKTPYPPKFSPGSPVLAVEGGVWVTATKVK